MLNFFPKIAILLLSLWIHDLAALQGSFGCDKGFKRNTDLKSAVCTMQSSMSPFYKDFQCTYSSCWLKGNKWIPMGGCQLPGFGASDQKCITYKYDEKAKVFSCTNAGGVTYICPNYTPNDVPSMVCTECQFP
ncbi:uncharacterized protein MELLADRAFT_123764 [Melampsora larici-populina 98AG31]|uniref:Secreted protein n=1 Tax=Melampsora larici-populina (strain 98AG31 / pathotype 3-4-7) TaxID=747676 RepID=F4R442_MELLP|nr:uncharacterized protein MELLADRAFT_123764 [Melampsora larici-populina 98AG31]EGG13057.1 secreted protein [Melampsora larici-populina 98AG31]